MDDYSRAIAGYYLTFSAPSAIQTALALRQAIWRKSDPAWHVCGIPDVLYTEYAPRSIFGNMFPFAICAVATISS